MSSTGQQIDDAVAKRHVQNADSALGPQSADLDMNLHKIIGLADPAGDRDAAHKKYVLDNMGGNVVGPASAIAEAVPLFSGTTGKLIKDSARIVTGVLVAGSDLPDADAIIAYGNTHWTAGSGNVNTAGAPVVNDFAKFTDATHIEGRSYAETLADLGIEVGATADQTGGEIVSAINAGVDLIDDDNIAASIARDTEVNAKVSDAVYGAGWDGIDSIAPSKNAVYDKIETLGNYTNLIQFVDQTAWRLFYSNTAGDVIELVLGASGQYLKSNGAAAAPTWGVPSGAGDVVGPGAHAASYVPQWNATPNSKVLVEGFAITVAGKALIDDTDAAAQRATLGLLSAALRDAEDTLTDGANLPDGHAIKVYGDANWSGGSSPGGADTQIQFNSSGSFAGDADFTWTQGGNVLNLANAEIQSLDSANSDFTLDSSPLVGAWTGWTYKGANVIKVKQAQVLPTNGSSHYFMDGLQVNHYDGDTTNYQPSNTQHEMHCCNLDMTGIVSSIQYKDMIGLSVRVLGRIGWAARGVSAITCETKQFGTGIASNEFHVVNPAAAEGGYEQSTSIAGLQLVTKPHFGDEDGTHIYRGLMIDNFGKRITHGIYMSSNADGYGNGDMKYGLSMDNATVTAAAILMPASRTGHVGTIIEYDSNDYSYFDRGSNLFAWVVGGIEKVAIDTSRLWTVSANIELDTFGQAFKGKDQGGSMLNLVYAGAAGYCMVGGSCSYTNIGSGSAQANPVIIRVNGTDGKQIFVGATDSGGSGYRMLRVTN